MRATMGPIVLEPCPSSTLSPLAPLTVLRSPPTSMLFRATIWSASIDPPTSSESSLSSAPTYALPPMSRSFSSVRLPDTRKSPPTSTSTPLPFPLIDARPPTSRELNDRSALLSNFPPTSTSPPSPPSPSVARPPTSILENLRGLVDSNFPPTSTSLLTSPPPIRAIPPTSSCEHLTRPAMSTLPPTSTSSKSSARAFPPTQRALSILTEAASSEPSMDNCLFSTLTSPEALRSPRILILPPNPHAPRAENSEHDRLPWNSASPSQMTRPVTSITAPSGSTLAPWPTRR